MKKYLFATIIAVLCLAILLRGDVLESLMLFLLVGVIPGTTYALPPTAMMALMFICTWLLLYRLFVARMVAEQVKKIHHNKKTSRSKARKKQPSRRLRRA